MTRIATWLLALTVAGVLAQQYRVLVVGVLDQATTVLARVAER